LNNLLRRAHHHPHGLYRPIPAPAPTLVAGRPTARQPAPRASSPARRGSGPLARGSGWCGAPQL